MLPQKYKLVLCPFQLIFGIALIMSFKFLILSEAHLTLPQNRFFLQKNNLSSVLFYYIVDFHSLQFDPAPRRGEPHVTRRTPDYFL